MRSIYFIIFLVSIKSVAQNITIPDVNLKAFLTTEACASLDSDPQNFTQIISKIFPWQKISCIHWKFTECQVCGRFPAGTTNSRSLTFRA